MENHNLERYANIFEALAYIVPGISVFVGIIVASEAESFSLFLYFLVGSVVFFLWTHSYAKLLQSTLETENTVQKISYKVFENNAASSSNAGTGNRNSIFYTGKEGWTCSCGRKNPSYTSTCACGVNKSDVT